VAQDYETVSRKVDEIEAEMRRVGVWQAGPPPAERMEFRSAFAADTLAFEQWLQFVLVPRVRGIVAARGQFPSGSEVADQAFREWKMYGERDDVDRLIELLREFDAMFE
jgi:uncharacterized protein YqcC (DUF446 family)